MPITPEEIDAATASLPPEGGAIDPFDFQAQQLKIARRQAALTKLMRQQLAAEGQGQPEGQMMGGRYVAPHWTQRLHPGIQRALTTRALTMGEDELEQAQSAYNKADTAAAQRHAASRPKPDPTTGVVDPQALSAWAQKGANIPSRRDVIASIIKDVEVNEPVRQEARVNKRQDTAAAAAAALAKEERDRIEKGEQLAADRVERAARDKQASEDRRYMVSENNETRRALIAAGVDKAEAAAAAKEAALRAKSKAGALGPTETRNLLNDAAALVPSATSSGLGSAVDTGLGFFGKSTGSADNASKLKVIGGNLLLSVPRFEGPQSDKDTQVYKDMAGRLGDPSIPASQKLAAIEAMHAINERYASKAAVAPTAPPVRVKSPAEARALKPGTRFVTPSGEVMVR